MERLMANKKSKTAKEYSKTQLKALLFGYFCCKMK